MALLPLLGAGQTPKDGKYQKTVHQGVEYLIRQMKRTPQGGDLRGESTAYIWQAIATLALCEAYGMTQDKLLLEPAQQAVDFVAGSQDETTGGWRSKPGGKPDTVVTAWQIMALKSAHLTYLKVPEATVKRVEKYLQSVALEEGMQYSRFGTNEPDDTATSAALLCRGGYLGWQREQWVPTPDASDPPWRGEKMLRPDSTLARGVARLGNPGPAPHNAMQNYFSTMLLFAVDDEFEKWHRPIREQLVKKQATEGADKGSWFDPKDPQAPGGGRLWQTALATMTLEVYYRHLPIYRRVEGMW